MFIFTLSFFDLSPDEKCVRMSAPVSETMIPFVRTAVPEKIWATEGDRHSCVFEPLITSCVCCCLSLYNLSLSEIGGSETPLSVRN